jgi:DNA-binding IclR family transcriptional regulator
MINLASQPLHYLRTLTALNALTTAQQPASVDALALATGYDVNTQQKILIAMARQKMASADMDGLWNITPDYAVGFVRGVAADDKEK